MQHPHDHGHGGRPRHTPMMPYTPIRSLKRELGIMFGFIALSIITMAAYWIFWQFAQRRNAARERARREDFAARERALANISEMKKSHQSSSSGSHDQTSNNESTGKMARNGNSDGGLGFGDVRENLVV
ncbi:hypothetical protein H112_03948 [Trichophyton rubrum D6]|uniref:Uncharacterized protein n=4 Tax=Trichophyton TaxID=5550 RepID=A0A178EYL3_TRIRU|nr:uncharacterized protein TERG_05274 [Trichophyton rubrum CBS 118892]EZF42364.1 hypothetical protein H102_03943 [Trichophyton rubrum CBS 100081]EZF53029.1 hypothetical protein H103_03957 [Trichophyton rubrum CBS 288.86]EZF63668.1 hypothetical protein H104_03943 [Trichophyton rubrum CBS 289.86]EZF74272.1 hypothetical protein H105_03971 [Trichophyton soudanense CBS 452.61]EZF84947.1 hypothetical protein H110_03950 [Trichophyton rubrum MR1448]EZF95696.1 hypothetical protein H113_03983 [Trichoph